MYFLAETEITNTKIWSAVEPENVLLLYKTHASLLGLPARRVNPFYIYYTGHQSFDI